MGGHMRHQLYRYAIGCVLSAIVGSAANAADIPRKALPYSSPVYAPVWTGFYVGANAGYGWASYDAFGTEKMKGFIGGGQLGYNWQISSFVLGAEADIQYSAQKRTETTVIGGVTFTGESKVPWFGTARGRVGYAFDSVLIYGTGGVAWSNLKASVSALGATVSTETTKMGWTAGAGVEWMFMPSWSVKAEYLYIDSGTTDLTVAGVTASGKLKDQIARIGVNYHF
jgi:outer membrane immunogenic protein